MADSFQNEVPKARINLKLDLHTGGASKKMELPLKLLVAGDFSNGQESAQISEREKVNITKNNFDSVLSEYSPKLNLTVKNTLSEDGGEDSIQLTFQSMKDFTPEQVAAQIKPGGDASLDMPMEEEAQFVAVVGLFRHPDMTNDTWKQVIKRSDLDPDKPRILEAGENHLTLQPLKDN
ncbi:hypothetical protein EAG21025_30370 [Enterobacter asburiae]|uniref:type VI secretion system contractile sheath small subunit n=1 Tax=Enterobacter asburiae TaxID=61645 RepID=UPI0034E897A3|nr:type VI secretion system contractile sheath small subunit [Enterobacter asburiae]